MKQKIPNNPILFGIFASKPHKKWAIGALTAVFIASVVSRFTVVVLKNLTDAVAGKQFNIDQIWFWALAFPIVYLIGQCTWRVSGFTGMRWFMGMRTTIYQTLYQYLSLHSKEYFNSRFAGALTNKINNAVEGTDSLYGRMLWDFIPLALGLIWYMIFAGASSWILGLIIGIWALIFIGLNILFVKKLQPLAYNSAKSLSTLKGKIVDSLSNMSLVHEYAHASEERGYINRYIKHQYNAGISHWWVSEWILVANGVLISLFMLVMIGSSVYLFQQNIISIGVIVMVVAIVGDLSNQFFFIGQELSNATRYYGETKEGLDEVLQKHTIIDTASAKPLKIYKGTITIKNVGFEYGEKKVFEDFSLTIKGGEKIGLVGKSGAGKTTFASLLLRHFDVQDGAIEIDNQNISNVTLESLRQNISFVPQDTSLFHRTIRENISYGSPDATDKEVVTAARLSHADEFITQMPDGYDTLVGERGVKLSGGQRQRIAIARAFLKDAPIVILDEATSSLDSQSEFAIQESIESLMQHRTVIAIAHRLSTLKKMDRIVVIENGQIAEDGLPETLLKKKNGIFKKMWDHQINGFIIDD